MSHEPSEIPVPASATQEGPTPVRRWSTWSVFALALLICLIAALVLYGRTLSFGFVNMDDCTYVVDNPLTERLDLVHVRRMLSEMYFSDYLPVLQVFLAIERAMLGSPSRVAAEFCWSDYHAVSLFLHALNGALVFILLRKLLGDRPGALGAASIAVGLFLAHPVQVETVAWIAQQKTLLATAFVLASVLCYAAFRSRARALREAGCVARPLDVRRSMFDVRCSLSGFRISSFDFQVSAFYIASLFFCACALFAKSSAVVLPVLLVLYDVSVAEKRFRRSIAAVWPMLLLAAVAACTTVRSQAASGAIPPDQGGSLAVRLLTMPPIFAGYLGYLLFPGGLAYFHEVPLYRSLASPVVVAGLLVLLAAGVAVVLAAARARPVLFWWGWYIAGLLPVLNFIPLTTLMAERYLYLPMIGLAGCAAWAVVGFARATASRPSCVRALKCLAALSLILFALLTVHQARHWRSSLAVWQNALVHSPERPTAWYNLADAYRELAEQARVRSSRTAALRGHAVRAMEQNLARFGNHPLAMDGLAAIYWQAGDRARALSISQKARNLFPRDGGLHANYGRMLVQMGSLAEAVGELELALRLGLDTVDEADGLHLTVARLCRRLGRIDAARTHAQAAASARSPATRAEAERIMRELGR